MRRYLQNIALVVLALGAAVAAGAEPANGARRHWAYQKPARPPLPPVKDSAWVRNPIDAFVLARLEKKGLRPSPEAPGEILIRRLSLDLVGLPPSPSEVDAFVADKSHDAYENLVDRLLASPHYGERWARPWLDMARYADTNGYEKDNRRSIWPWRDWVIRSLNADMSFRQFTLEQIAGDMLPGATPEQKVATGFHRNTMLNEEGGVDAGEARWLTLVDRVGTTGAVWLGSTVACGQCHNHKYDPLTQKEFYGLLAFFENADEPQLSLLTAEQEGQKKALEAQIAKLDSELNGSETTPQLAAEQAEWEKKQSGAAKWKVLKPETAAAANGTSLKVGPDHSVLASGDIPATETYTVTANTGLKGITGVRLEVLPDPTLRAGGPGAADNGNFVLSELKVTASVGGAPAQPVSLKKAAADYSQNGYPVAAAIDGSDSNGTGWAVDPQFGQSHVAVFETKEPLDAKPAGAAGEPAKSALALTFLLECRSPFARHNLGRFRLSVTTSADPAFGLDLPENVRAALAFAPEQRTDAQKRDLATHFRSVAPSLREAREKVAQLRRTVSTIKPATTLVMQERPSADPPATDLRVRGSYLSRGERVTAGVPAVLNPLPPGAKPDRLALAQWLVDDNNPLTARVQVNRMWEGVFGIGLVETSEDFGTQGTPPSHPELLDWLATEFMGRGWRMKAIHRMIVTSATYRQSSAVTPDLFRRDPYNRTLARGARFRVDAEAVRDVALAVSGKLSEKMFGPSVFPPQPSGIWNVPYSGEQWVDSDGEDRYRRGIYTFKRRSAPYPTFMSFDAPSGEVCTVRRIRTNTPMQALTVLNDPAFVELARALARRIMKETPAEDARARATFGFRLCVSRAPKPSELDRLVEAHARELKHYRKDLAAAMALTKGPPAYPAGTDVADLAAWTVVANVLLNLDETVTKN